jgi:hypothetical protein
MVLRRSAFLFTAFTLALASSFSLPAQAQAAAAFVQATNAGITVGGASITTSAFGSSVTTGDSIIVAVDNDCSTGISVSGVTDSTGVNTYTMATSTLCDPVQGQALQIWYAQNVTGGSSFTVTANFTSASSFRRIVAHEVSGLATAASDKHAEVPLQASASPSVGPVTTSKNGEYVFGAIMNTGGANTDTFSAGGGFTEPANSTASAADFEVMAEYQVQSTAGSITAPFTRSNSGDNQMAMATFLASTQTCQSGYFDTGLGACRKLLTSGTTWTVPTNWNSSNNTIEVIGGGGAASDNDANGGYGGGGGGAYAKKINQLLTRGGSVTIRVGGGGLHAIPGGMGGDTIFNGTGTTCDAAQTSEVCGQGGGGAPGGGNGAGGTGGAAASSVGTASSGGDGGGYGSNGGYGGGGGGAAGPHGAGAAGGNGDTCFNPNCAAGGGGGADGGFPGGHDGGGGTPGSKGGNNFANTGGTGGTGGAQSNPPGAGIAGTNGGGGGAGGWNTRNDGVVGTGGAGGPGGAGTEWNAISGSGGGGGAGGSIDDVGVGIGGAGGAGGLYGGGGAGAGADFSGNDRPIAGNGAQGIIVVTYTPSTTGRIIRLRGGVRLLGGVRLGGSSPVPRFDPATIVWVNAVTTAGGTVSATQESYVNTLITCYKSAGVFSIMDREWLLWADNIQQAETDLIHDATWTSHGTAGFAANAGYTGDGSTSYLDSSFDPASAGGNFGASSANFDVYITHHGGGVELGVVDGSYTYINAEFMGYDLEGATFPSLSNPSTAVGLWSVFRTDGSNSAAYKNGSSYIASGSDPAIVFPNRPIFIGAQDDAGTADNFSSATLAMAGFGGGLTTTQAAAKATCDNAYATSKGFNVF